jgi:hypothetical protein
MTVAELITKLSNLDQTREIFLPGYEGGFKDVRDISTEILSKNVNTELYYGPHDYDDNGQNYYVIR